MSTKWMPETLTKAELIAMLSDPEIPDNTPIYFEGRYKTGYDEGDVYALAFSTRYWPTWDSDGKLKYYTLASDGHKLVGGW